MAPKTSRKRRIPDPPPALVQLLQSDPSVLEYFQAVQIGVKQDSQYWKDKYHEAVKKQKAPTKKRKETAKKAVVSATENKRKKKESVHVEDADNRSTKDTVIQPFQMDSSSDEEDYDDSFLLQDFEENDDSSGREFETMALPYIQYAQDCLNQLNVSLVNTITKTTKQKGDDVEPVHDQGESTGMEENITTTYRAVSDEDVVAAFLLAIRNSTRKTENQPLLPFIEDVPGCNQPEHPSFGVKRRICHALLVLDTFSNVQQEEPMEVGWCRPDLVPQLMLSLEQEIIKWPMADRRDRLHSKYLHFDGSSEVIGEHETSKSISRLQTLLERTIQVQLVTSWLISGAQERRAMCLLWYYIEHGVSAKNEERKLPPALSLLVVEAMLTQPGLEKKNAANPWFTHVLSDEDASILFVLARAVRNTEERWRLRCESLDERIRDIAIVECAAAKRLQALPWWHDTDVEDLHAGLVQVQNEWAESALVVSAILDDNVSDSDFSAKTVSRVHKQLLIRQLPNLQRQVGSSANANSVERLGLFDVKVPVDVESDDETQLLDSLESALILGNGEKLNLIVSPLLNRIGGSLDINRALEKASEYIVVRVINLDWRRDRWNAFVTGCMYENLVVLKGVASLPHLKEVDGFDYFGRHAFDGSGRLAEALGRLSEQVGGSRRLDKLVAPEWRPNDLKPFDRDAPKDEGLVFTSPTERACALSHISAWYGVARSIRLSGAPAPPSDLEVLRRSFRISGFAKGEALLDENCNMPPSPVCLILEDDAVLCDNFSERLLAILEELPRDFHFLSLGYSRPKTAPIVPFRSKIGIPSGLWYMTGYILSLQGVEYLTSKLPVVGPVDSWVALLMLQNWDNIYGQEIGVGNAPRGHSKIRAPSRSKLVQIFKFRTFCSLAPLCRQPIASDSKNTTLRNWRNRDSNVIYSGGDDRHFRSKDV